MAYNFADEPEDYRRQGTNVSPGIPEGTKCAVEFVFEESVFPNHIDHLWIMVDETSTKAEILAEQDKWEEFLHGWTPPLSLKKAVWELLAYLDELLESH